MSLKQYNELELIESFKELINDIIFIKSKNNLDILNEEFLDIEKKTLEKDFWEDRKKAEIIIKHHSFLKGQIESINKINDLQELIEEAIELYNEDKDNSFLLSIKEEMIELQELVQKEKIKSLFSSKKDLSNCYLEIHSGTGGTDAQDFVSMIYRMYFQWAKQNNFKVIIIEEQRASITGFKSVILKIEGKYAYGYLKGEKGVHRLIRISPFNSESKRHTSFIAVNVYDEVQDVEEEVIISSDLKIETFKSSGAGGQHVNTTDSSVRITHIPTGIIIKCQSQRSQHKNKELALNLLRVKLLQEKRAKKQEEKKSKYSNQDNIDFGSHIRSYILHPYQVVKDHRTLYENNSPKDVLNGNINDFILRFLTR